MEEMLPFADLVLRHTLEGSPKQVKCVAWSPDGKLLASGTSDGTIWLWDLSTGALLYKLNEHNGWIDTLAWSPDGKQLASCSSDWTVQLWDVSSGVLLHSFEGHRGMIWSLAWSPDGQWLASSSSDWTIRLWNPVTGGLVRVFKGHREAVGSMVWSPDGTRLASGSHDWTVRIWDPKTGVLLHTLRGHRDWIWSLVWSLDGQWLASGSNDWAVRIWDPKTGVLLHSLKDHTHWVKALAWSPDNRWLVSGSDDGTVRIWDPRIGTPLYILEGHIGVVRSVAWSADGRWLVSGSDTDGPTLDADIRIWRTDSWEVEREVTNLQGGLHASWSPRFPMVVIPGERLEDIIVCKMEQEYLQEAEPGLEVGGRVIEEHLQQAEPIPETVHYAKRRYRADELTKEKAKATAETVHYANAKVVLVGDSGVGKSGLALVLTGQPFVATESTHGRHVWLMDQQEVQEGAGSRELREVWLWDLAGQPDYRLIHQLHLHEVTIALIIFDAARDDRPFAGIRHWQRALQQAQQARGSSALPLTILLVAARIDRGGRSVSRARIDELMQELGCTGYFETSAKDGRGIVELEQAIRAGIDWTGLPKVTSTKLLHDIKEFIFSEQGAGRFLRSTDDLYEDFLRSYDATGVDDLWKQFNTALGRLESQGYIRWLGFGNLVLLQPEVLDAYASALLIAVKDEPDGLGSIQEVRVQQGLFEVPAEDRLANPLQEKLLLIAMIEELVRQQLVLRESGGLLFPSQSTREHPDYAVYVAAQTVSFSFEGPVLSLYTTLVVRLAQCGIFQKQELWQHVVIYTTRSGGRYGLLLLPRGDEQADLGLFFDEAANEEMRFHFENFVRMHLERQVRGQVQRLRRFICPVCGEAFTEKQIANRRARGFTSMRCSTCETAVSILDKEELLSALPVPMVSEMERAADVQRDRESAISILQGKIATQDFDVFLCHNGQDKAAVKQIGEQLKLYGILPWLDEWELRPGLPWQKSLEEQIAQIKAAAVFVGKDGPGPWQQQELDAFLREFVERGCPVIPVLLADVSKKPVLPVFLRAMTWVDFRVQETDPMQRLIWGITGRQQGSTVRRPH